MNKRVTGYPTKDDVGRVFWYPQWPGRGPWKVLCVEKNYVVYKYLPDQRPKHEGRMFKSYWLYALKCDNLCWKEPNVDKEYEELWI